MPTQASLVTREASIPCTDSQDSHRHADDEVHFVCTYPLSSDAIVGNMRPDKELGHDAA
jgi:hypothetical protein